MQSAIDDTNQCFKLLQKYQNISEIVSTIVYKFSNKTSFKMSRCKLVVILVKSKCPALVSFLLCIFIIISIPTDPVKEN